MSASSGRLRVLLANDRLGYDNARFHGAGRLIVDWTRALMMRGVETTAVILRAPGPLGEAVLADGLPFVFLDRHPYDPRTLADLTTLIRRRSIDVLHLQAFGASTFGRLAARLTGTPAIMHVHADYRGEPKGYPWFVRAFDHMLAPHTAHVLAISDAVARFAIEVQGCRRAVTETLHNPIDLERFGVPSIRHREQARSSLGLSPDAKAVICLTRFHFVKGVDTLLDAWPNVANAVPKTVLLLVGDGPLRGQLQRQAESTGCNSTIRFLGYRSDVQNLFWAADVSVLPSRSEGLGLAALEAMACGLPVVGTRVGGIPEVIRDGENGTLTPPEDPVGLAHALNRLLLDPKLAARLGEEARRTAEGHSLSRFTDYLIALYRRTVEATRS